MKPRIIYRARITYTEEQTLELVASSLEEAEQAFEDGHGYTVPDHKTIKDYAVGNVWDLGPAFDDM
jgi:hypothetical protein